MAFHDPHTPVLKIDNGRDFFIKGIVGHRDIYITTPRQSMEHPFHTVKYNGRRKVSSSAIHPFTMLSTWTGLIAQIMSTRSGRAHG